MKQKLQYLCLIGFGYTMVSLIGCDTSKNVYKSSKSKQNYFTIKAFTLSHCGCTQLVIDNFKKGKKEFNIFYTDRVLRKRIYTYRSGKIPNDTLVLLALATDNFTVPFDSLDNQIFNRVDSIIQKPGALIYPLKRSEYKGYIKDPYY